MYKKYINKQYFNKYVNIVIDFLLQVTEPEIENAEVAYRSSCRDAWITRRRRLQNNDLYDFVIIQLAKRAEIPIICIDTTNLFSNVARKFSVQAVNLPISGLLEII